ncbi:hypothetical protein SNEBB_003962 [Seison nebaliae]|nr:hypothetical protein SNEBB_003962 [Seison nebaliae]
MTDECERISTTTTKRLITTASHIYATLSNEEPNSFSKFPSNDKVQQMFSHFRRQKEQPLTIETLKHVRLIRRPNDMYRIEFIQKPTKRIAINHVFTEDVDDEYRNKYEKIRESQQELLKKKEDKLKDPSFYWKEIKRLEQCHHNDDINDWHKNKKHLRQLHHLYGLSKKRLDDVEKKKRIEEKKINSQKAFTEWLIKKKQQKQQQKQQ